MTTTTHATVKTPAHTPLRLSAGDETRIMDKKGYPLLDVKCGGMSGRTVKEGEQIAAFIVRACNSHYAAKNALKAAYDELSTGSNYQALEMVEAALSAMEGGDV